MLGINVAPTRIVIPGSQCTLEIIPNYGQLAYCDVFGIDWKKITDNPEYLEKKALEYETVHSHIDFLVIYNLRQKKKIRSIDKIVFLHKIETPKEMREKSLAKSVFTKFEQMAKEKGIEYILCCARDATEHRFMKSNNFENLRDNYWGKQLS